VVRMAKKIALLALIPAFFAGFARGEAPPSLPKPPAPSAPPSHARDGKGAVRLEEVRITGSPEHPGVLFFLPRARFRLQPLREGTDGQGAFLREDREKGALSP